MDLSPYVDQLRRELAAAAELGGEEARALAERLTAPLESSLRLSLLSALSGAAEEITAALAPGAVDLRLRGADIGFVVTPPPAAPDDAHDDPHAPGPPEPAPPPPQSAPAPEGEDGGTSRITLRLPDQLKNRVEDAAGREGLSVNAWLVRALDRALEPRDPAPAADRRRGRWSGPPSAGQQFTGWVR